MTIGPARLPLVLGGSPYAAMKDPCPVFDGSRWHLFGTGILTAHKYELLHATAPSLAGPWEFGSPVSVEALDGHCVAAPGVIVEGDLMHMFLQTDYNRLDGRIEHMVSDDGGESFNHARTALTSVPFTAEAGIYDPHPAQIGGERYLVYSAFETIGQPDVHLARSAGGSWDGPWERLGPILGHEDVPCHNQRGQDDYEWGLEGAQLLELPSGGVLLNAVCFVPDAPPGSRQRIFFATGDAPTGPYTVLGPVVTPPKRRPRAENGHGTVVLDGDELVLFFQERNGPTDHWRYALASISLADFRPSVREAARTVLAG